MTYTELFLKTMADLKRKISEGGEYNLIRACGLLRHLLLDKSCLVDIVNRTNKLKIEFEVIAYPDFNQKYNSRETIHWVFPQPGRKKDNVRVNKNNFLNRIIIKTPNDSYSIKEIIQMTAHVKGGIHSGKPSAKDKVLIEMEHGTQFKAEVDEASIMGICEVVIKGLKPLEEIVLRHTPADGF